MKIRKLLLWTGGILLALVLVVVIGGWGLVNSIVGRNTAADQLSQILGVPVAVDSLNLGTDKTSVALRIPDPDAGADANLIKIGQLNTDITLGGLLTGNATPTYVNADDVAVLLRIDEKGNILSPLPQPKEQPGTAEPPSLPEVRVEGATVRIRQSGKDEFAISGISAHLQRSESGYVLDGTVTDSMWGTWAMSGKLSADLAGGDFTVSSASAQLRDSQLRTIPFVPIEVWDHLSASGTADVSFTLSFRTSGELGYAVRVKPAKVSLTVPDIGVTLTDVTGDMEIADGTVTIANGSVALADGTAKVNGKYSFDQPTQVIEVMAEASGVNVKKLPKKWGLPPKLEGKLQGTANLELQIGPDGKPKYLGGGAAEVIGATFNGLKIDEFKLSLRGGENGYRFEQSGTGAN